jgi:hypothetical protein
MRYFFREWRRAAGLSLLDLADILGISEGQVSKIETNKRDFTGDYLVDFSVIVGCKQICDPLCKMPPNFHNRVGTLNPIEKLAIERRLQSRSKEIRKLRRADRSQGGGG